MQSRIQREKEAYDEDVVYYHSSRLQSRYWHVFACPNSQYLEKYFEEQISRFTPGAVVLDYGCYKGDLTEKILSYQPARLVGIDISENAIGVAKERYGSRAEFYSMDAHRTEFPDQTFDLIVGISVVHHLDVDLSLCEIKRLLKPGGVAVFSEPLRDNPAAKLIRWLTPKARTKDEVPLSRAQIQKANRLFSAHEHRFGNLLSVPVAMLTTKFIQRPDNWFLQATHQIDLLLSKTFLKYWMRRVILVWKSE